MIELAARCDRYLVADGLIARQRRKMNVADNGDLSQGTAHGGKSPSATSMGSKSLGAAAFFLPFLGTGPWQRLAR
jgi:hypothetical protein